MNPRYPSARGDTGVGPAKAFRLFPAYGPGPEAWVYAIGLPDGVTRVGVTNAPRKAVMQAWHSHPEHILWAHVFSPWSSDRLAQQVLNTALSLCSTMGERIDSTRMFLGLPKQMAIACVRAAAETYR